MQRYTPATRAMVWVGGFPLTAARAIMSSMHRRSVALVLLLLGLGMAPVARAQPDVKARARALGTEAGQLLDTQHYAEALERVDEAEKLFHAPTHLQMRGEALEGLGRLAEALEVFERLAAEPLAEDDPEAFKHAAQFGADRARALKRRVPALAIHVNGPPEDAVQITVDGNPYSLGGGKAPYVDAGTHSIVATAAGFRRVEREVTLAAEGAVHTVQIELEPAATEEPDEVDEEDSGTEGGFYWPPWVAFGVGGAGLLIGGITGALSFGKVGELEDECPDGRCAPEQQSLIDEAGTLGNVSTVGFIVGGVGVAAGVVLLLWRPGADEPGASTESAGPVRITPWVGPTALGVKGEF